MFGLEQIADAVGDNVAVRLAVHALVKVADVLRYIMYRVHPFEHVMEIFVSQVIYKPGFVHEYMRRKVFRKQMKARRRRNFFLFRNFCRNLPQREREHHVHDVRAFYRAFYNLFVRRSQAYAVLFQIIVEHAEVLVRNDVIPFEAFFVRVRTKHFYFVSAFFKVADKVHRSDGKTIVFLPQNVTNYRYFHCFLPFLYIRYTRNSFPLPRCFS